MPCERHLPPHARNPCSHLKISSHLNLLAAARPHRAVLTLEDDAADVPDDSDPTDLPEEAGYGYGV